MKPKEFIVNYWSHHKPKYWWDKEMLAVSLADEWFLKYMKEKYDNDLLRAELAEAKKQQFRNGRVLVSVPGKEYGITFAKEQV